MLTVKETVPWENKAVNKQKQCSGQLTNNRIIHDNVLIQFETVFVFGFSNRFQEKHLVGIVSENAFPVAGKSCHVVVNPAFKFSILSHITELI